MNLVTVSYVAAIAVAFFSLLVGGVRYTIKFIVWVSRALVLWEDVAGQFRPNHGSSLVDRFASLEAEVKAIRGRLDGDELANRRGQGA